MALAFGMAAFRGTPYELAARFLQPDGHGNDVEELQAEVVLSSAIG